MRRALLVLLLAVTAVVYSPVVGFDSVNFDDPGYVFANPSVLEGLTADGIRWAFQTGSEGNWHPITWISHMLDVQIYGAERPGGHHSTNVLLHLINTLLLFLFVERAFRHSRRALFVAALFALHPLHIESVAWISERKDVLSTAFWLASLLAYERYVRSARRSAYGWSLLFLAMGLMTKPMLVTAPFLLLLLDHHPWGRLGRRAILEKLPMLALVTVSAYVTYRVQDAGGAVGELVPWRRLLEAATAYTQYLGKTLWPDPLAILYPRGAGGPSLLAFAGSALLLLTITVGVLRASQERTLRVGWFWFLGTMVPVIGLVQIGSHSIADRYTYFSMTGLALTACWGFERLRAGRGGNSLAWSISLLVLLLLGGRTVRQLPVWRNSSTLFEHTLAVTRDNDIVHNNYATWLAQQGAVERAVDQYRASLQIRPSNVLARWNLVLTLQNLKRDEEAIEVLRPLVEQHPEMLEYRLRYVRLLLDSGRSEEALEHLDFLLEREPESSVAWNDRGGALMRLGRVQEAAEAFRTAARIRPDYGLARRNLAGALLQQGEEAEAIASLRSYLEEYPDDGTTRLILERLESKPSGEGP